ncbi:heme peroxidase [Mycena sanguinolenta]|nr:heme peroxidase [Mycena sanguinolenta]
MFHRTLFSSPIFLATVRRYIWPTPQLDELESARFDQKGFNANALSGFLQSCNSFIFGSNTGRSNAADWLRTARLSRLLIVGIGGPEIAFRGGRIDATEANAPGVPKPEEDLASHVATFARQGFTQTEMISLVACGHTFGGVQHDPFPDIVNVLNDKTDTLDVAHFDSTLVTFDNTMYAVHGLQLYGTNRHRSATEYISGTTKNPLVVGFNETTNSDKRIFGSDGNATMLSFAYSPDLFASTCADLFARMIDTVPSGVVLTDVLTPLPVKPAHVFLTMNGGVLELSADVRLWNTTNTKSNVNMLWKDHAGGTSNRTMTPSGPSSSTGGKYNAAWYSITSANFLSIDPAAGVTSLSFLVDGQLEDQNGLGFAIQDGFMLSKTSCQISPKAKPARFDVAVRNGLNVTRVYLEQITADSLQRTVVVETDIPPPTQPVAINSYGA